MGNYHAGTVSAGAGSTTLPIGSVFAAAAVAFRLTEFGVFNTTATSCKIKLARFSGGAGTPGSGLVETPDDPAQPGASSTAFDTHTVTPNTITDLGYRTTLAGAIGAGIIWTFDDGIYVPAGTGNGVGIIVVSGTGQIVDWYAVWKE